MHCMYSVCGLLKELYVQICRLIFVSNLLQGYTTLFSLKQSAKILIASDKRVYAHNIYLISPRKHVVGTH